MLGPKTTTDAPTLLGSFDWRWLLPATIASTVGWVAGLQVFVAPARLALFGFAASFVLALLGVRCEGAPPPRRARTIVAAGAYALLAGVVPTPMRFSLICLAVCAAAAWLCSSLPAARRVALAGFIVGVSGLCEGLAAELARYVLLRARYWPILNGLAATVFSYLGLSTSAVDGILYVNSSTQLLKITPNAEKLGLIYLVVFMGGLAPWLIASGQRGMFYFKLSALLSCYVLWQYLATIAVYAQCQLADVYWDPLIAAAFLAALSAAIYWTIPISRRLPRLTVPAASESTWHATVLSTLTAAALACAAGWAFALEDAGVAKARRVVVDESHSNWEWTQREYDTSWYGDKAGYNYATLFSHLGRYYHMRRNENRRLTSRVLDDCDILVLKTPTRAYDDGELDAICRFVERGGGLYLIGDHTNVFGMTTYLNQVAERFGFSYGYDATYELATGALQRYEPPTFLRHPTIMHLPARFLFGTSCSLKPGWRSAVGICGYNIRGLYLDYSRRSFFPEGHLEGSMDFGWIAQSLGARVGRGRVAAFTDSTIFSNFWYFIPGKNELFVSTLEWLNRSNSPWHSLLRLGPLALASAGVLRLVRRKRFYVSFGSNSIAAVVAGAAVGVFAGDYSNRQAYSWPPTSRPPTVVLFDRDSCDMNIPAYELPGGARSFHTFYTWVQRIGFVPAAFEKTFSSLDDADVLVMVFANRAPRPEQEKGLRRWIEQGGTLIVLDGFSNTSPCSNEWLAGYGIRFDYAGGVAGEIIDLNHRRWTATGAMRVRGGLPFLFAVPDGPPPAEYEYVLPDHSAARGAPVGAAVAVGDGRLLVVGLADSFQDSVMGTTRTVPNDLQSELYELEYALLRAAARDGGGECVPLPVLGQ